MNVLFLQLLQLTIAVGGALLWWVLYKTLLSQVAWKSIPALQWWEQLNWSFLLPCEGMEENAQGARAESYLLC